MKQFATLLTTPLIVTALLFTSCSSLSKSKLPSTTSAPSESRRLTISDEAVEVYNNNMLMIKLYFDGKVQISEDYNPTKAALEFWTSVSVLFQNSQASMNARVQQLNQTRVLADSLGVANTRKLEELRAQQTILDELLETVEPDSTTTK